MLAPLAALALLAAPEPPRLALAVVRGGQRSDPVGKAELWSGRGDLKPGRRLELVDAGQALPAKVTSRPLYLDLGHDGAQLDGQTPAYRYTLRLDPKARPAEGVWVARLPGKGEAGDRYRRCASDDGWHLTAWAGERRVWHAFVKAAPGRPPDCQPAETQP